MKEKEDRLCTVTVLKMKISVIIPTYNRANVLQRAVKSVLEQSYQDFELIIVDDGSEDNTGEIVKSFDDSRIRYIKLKNNMGAPFARNTGINASNGEFIAFQDSDNEWLAGKLEKQMKIFEKASEQIGVVYTGVWKVENDRKCYIPDNRICPKEGNIHEMLLDGNFIDLPTSIVRKECFSQIGMFDERLACYQDWELFIRISKYYHFAIVDEGLSMWYCQEDSISRNGEGIIQAFELILDRHLKEFKNNKRILIKHYNNIGSLLALTGEMKKARKYLLKSLSLHRLAIKLWIAVFLTFLGQSVYRKISEYAGK